MSCWTTQDLDHILIQGGNLYKPLNKESFLSVDDLPREIHIYQYTISVEMKLENLHDGVAFLGEPFLRNGTGCSLLICNYATAIIKHLTASTLYFILDSRSRNNRGITDSRFGFSVLLQFAV